VSPFQYKSQGQFRPTVPAKCAPGCKLKCCVPNCTCTTQTKVFRFSASPNGINWHHLVDLSGMGAIDSFTTVRWS